MSVWYLQTLYWASIVVVRYFVNYSTSLMQSFTMLFYLMCISGRYLLMNTCGYRLFGCCVLFLAQLAEIFI